MNSLNDIANKYGTDKGDKHSKRHGYTFEYDKILSPLRNKPIKMLEIGVKSIHFPGASLKMWEEYFTNPKIIVGFDIVDASEYNTDIVETFQGDQSSVSDLNKLKNKFDFDFDFIIDDGSHRHAHQVASFINLFDKVKQGGYYFIEDLDFADGRKTVEMFDKFINGDDTNFGVFRSNIDKIYYTNNKKLLIIKKI